MAAAALYRSPALLLRLRHRLLFPESARLLSSRADPLADLSSWIATANTSSSPASLPSPLWTGYSAPSLHTLCPPSPLSSPSISCNHPRPPRPTLSALSILPQRGHSTDHPCQTGLLAAVEAGRGALPVWGKGALLQAMDVSKRGFLSQNATSVCEHQKQMTSSGCERSLVEGSPGILQTRDVSRRGSLSQHVNSVCQNQKRMMSCGCEMPPVEGSSGMQQLKDASRPGFLSQHTSCVCHQQKRIMSSGCERPPVERSSGMQQLKDASRRGFPSQHTSCVRHHQKRMMSSGCKKSPVAHLLNLDSSELLDLEWLGPVEFLKKYSPLRDLRANPLNLELPGFADRPTLHLTEFGAAFIHGLIYLVLANNNGGHCVKAAFTKDNILVCPKLKQVRFKTVDPEPLDDEITEFDRAAAYTAAAFFLQDILEEIYGPKVMSYLSIEVTDLLNKMFLRSDERLIVYHTALLSDIARGWFFQRVYQLAFQILSGKRTELNMVFLNIAYIDMKRTVEDIIPTHPLLYHIEHNQDDRTEDTTADLTTDIPTRKGHKHESELARLARKMIALPRHTIQHAFDVKSKMVVSGLDHTKTLWPYSLEEVIDMLNTAFPLHLLKAQEAFLKENLWSHLKMELFWERQLGWMGDIPEPSGRAEATIAKVSYGKRRLNAIKFGRPNQRPRP